MNTVDIARACRGLLVVTAVLPLLVVGCGDDDPLVPGTGESPWSAVPLPEGLPESSLWSVEFQGTRGLALGVTATQSYLLETVDGSTWGRVDIPDAPAVLFLLDLAFASDGRAVVVGATASSPAVYAERPAWTSIELSGAAGGLQTVVRENGDSFLAAGAGNVAVPAFRGGIDGPWTPQAIPTPGDPQEKAITDLAVGAEDVWACGWDDGADGSSLEPGQVLLRYRSGSWSMVETACGGCSTYEFRTVAVTQGGGVLLGGAITDFSGGADDSYVAFLHVYNPADEAWTNIPLPEPGALNAVNDILVASDGTAYLACGEGNGAVVRLPDVGSAALEWSCSTCELMHLAQGPEGVLYAAGSSGTPSNPAPLLLQRHPEVE